MKVRLVVLAALLTIPGLLFAGTSCATPTVVPADGRIVDFDFVAQSGDNFYQVDVTAGHSYSIELRQDYDDLQSVNDLATQVFGVGDGTCSTPLAVAPAPGSAVRDTTAIDPVLPANSFRVSTTASSTGTMRVKVHNNNGSTGRYISVVVADTTMFSPLYTTFSGFNTFYRFFNTTNQAVRGTLKLLNTDGSVLVTNTFTVSAGASSETVYTGVPAPPAIGLSVPASRSGPAFFTHDGPPGAIMIDGFQGAGQANGGFTTFPIAFRPVREKQ
jgi:hypothetical protein